MNWITTNIRLPEDLYLELKMESTKQRKSMAQIARERLAGKKFTSKQSKSKYWENLEKFAKVMAKSNPGAKLSRSLIEMRYEQ